MYNDAVNTNTVEFVRLGQDVSPHFLADIPNQPTLSAVLMNMTACNNFDPMMILATCEEFFPASMQVEIGQEGSPVMYVSIPFFTHQRHGAPRGEKRQRYTDPQRRVITQMVIDWAHEMQADEITVQQHPTGSGEAIDTPGSSPYRVRIWWD